MNYARSIRYHLRLLIAAGAMPIYEIDIIGRITIKAYNVVQAKKQAMKYRIIGSSYGLSGGKHDRDLVPYERQHAALQIGKIRKLP